MSKSALVVLDMQAGVIEKLGGTATDPDQYLATLSWTVAEARKAGIPVIQVTTSFRPGYSDASPRNQIAARIRAAGAYKDTDPAAQLHPAIAAAAADDIHVKKRRVSAFHGTDLDLVLRSSGIEKIAVAGLATSGAVLSTIRQAADMDYEITVLDDLCADPDPDVHKILIEKVFPKQASVVGAEEWLAYLYRTK
jgi:nicotinamidase-related amidase